MEVKLNKSDQAMAMQFDQEQLNQITQLINNMNQQQQSINILPMNHDNQPNSSVQMNFTELNTAQQQQQNIQFQNPIEMNANFYNTTGNSQTQFASFTSPNQGYKAEPAQQLQGEMIQEVHTIMVNGQPALFIPASSAISNNLLCQMMMSSQSQVNSQFELMNQPTDQTTQNQIFQTAATNNNNSDFFWNGSQISAVDDTAHNQQIICVQSDGNITFQSMPFQAQVSASESTEKSKEKTEASTIGFENVKSKKARIQPKTPNRTPKANTVASALANTSNIAQKKLPKKPRPSVSV